MCMDMKHADVVADYSRLRHHTSPHTLWHEEQEEEVANFEMWRTSNDIPLPAMASEQLTPFNTHGLYTIASMH